VEFKNGNKNAYHASVRNKWIEKICGHMHPSGTRYKRCVYVYEFPDNNAYIGITYNIAMRQQTRARNKQDAVTKHILKTGLYPAFRTLTDYIDVNIAVRLEKLYIDIYKIEGWDVLNKKAAGAVGGNNLVWTKEKCQEEALKYKTRRDFMANNFSVYSIACRRGWIGGICSHMTRLSAPPGYYTKEMCRDIVIKYTTRKELNIDYPHVMSAIYKNKWAGELCSHMKNMRGNEEMRKEFRVIFGKPVLQYSLEGDFIKEFISISDAARSVGVTMTAISGCCNPKDRHKSCNGFIWKFKQNK
jgi:predicted GIY-YIG superfamily endonuclease